MKNLTIPIDQAGRVVLPKDVRRELAIKAGDMLEVTVAGSAVTLTPSRVKTGLKRKGKALVFTSGRRESLPRETVQEVLDSTREEAINQLVSRFERKSRK